MVALRFLEAFWLGSPPSCDSPCPTRRHAPGVPVSQRPKGSPYSSASRVKPVSSSFNICTRMTHGLCARPVQHLVANNPSASRPAARTSIFDGEALPLPDYLVHSLTVLSEVPVVKLQGGQNFLSRLSVRM